MLLNWHNKHVIAMLIIACNFISYCLMVLHLLAHIVNTVVAIPSFVVQQLWQRPVRHTSPTKGMANDSAVDKDAPQAKSKLDEQATAKVCGATRFCVAPHYARQICVAMYSRCNVCVILPPDMSAKGSLHAA